MIRKIIVNFFILFIVVFVIDFAVGRTLKYFYFNETSGLHFRTTYSMEVTEADLLIFGSSRANHNYVPEVFEDSLNMSYYNTGRDGNGIFYQTAVLKTVLKRYNPKVIILDYTGSFEKITSDYDKLSSLSPYYSSHEEIQKIVELKSPFEKVKMLSEIYPFNSEVLRIAIGNSDFNLKRKSDNKGYVALYKEWQTEIDSIPNYKSYEIDSNKLSSFKEFITIAKESGAKVFVVYSPIFHKFDKSQEIDICTDICNSQNVPFLDYSKDTLFLQNKQLFQDIGHLNDKGALTLSKLVVEKIKFNIKNKP